LGDSSPATTLNVYSPAIRSDRAGLTEKLASMFAGQKEVTEAPPRKSVNILETSGAKSVRTSNRLAAKSLIRLAPRVGIHIKKAVNSRHFVIAASEDTPTDTPADDWLSPNTCSCSWTSNI
jgi:hypothetical protein